MTTAFIEAGVTELSFVGSTQTSTTGGSIAPHGNSVAGDVAILCCFTAIDSPGVSAPSGWSAIDTVQSPGLGAATGAIYIRILEAGDLGLAVSGIDDGNIQRQVMMVFHPDEEIDSLTVSAVNEFANSSDPPNQIVSASGQQTPLVVVGWNACTNVDFDDMTSSPAFDATIQTTNAARAGYKIYNESPANHTISAEGSGERVLMSFYFRVE